MILITENELECERSTMVDTPDLLDRQPFIDRVIEIANMLADNKKNACYAINGGWGVGKTYALGMFENQVRNYGQEGTTLGKFLVLHYNCWQYDYYEEPLIAIVSAMMDAIDEQVCLLPSEKKEEIKAALREIAKDLLNDANRFIIKKTGINIRKYVTFWKAAKEEAEKKVREDYQFDTYFDFKKKLIKLKDTIASLAKDQTVIFVVDELDRCLPEYTVKILERLHHLFEGIPNVQVILSIDRSQLEHVVKQIYGVRTNVRRYLDKFIHFEIALPIGSMNEYSNSYFSYYYRQFDNQRDMITNSDLQEFKEIIFEGIDMRSRIALIEKCNLLHSIMSDTEEKADVIFMAIQMFLIVLKFGELDPRKAKENFSIDTLFHGDKISREKESSNKYYTLPGLAVIRVKLANLPIDDEDPTTYSGTSYLTVNSRNRTIVMCEDIWGILLACYRKVLGFEGDLWNFPGSIDPAYQKYIQKYVSDYWRLLKIIS